MQNITLNNITGLLFSASRHTETANVNELRTQAVREYLKTNNIAFVDCMGIYTDMAGVTSEEKSFLVVSSDKDTVQDLIDLALQEYAQESVMLIEGQGSARLLFANGQSERLGFCKEVSKVEASSFVASTLRLDNLTYWTCTNTPKKQ
jgi:hypothetical protein